ncbi:hypothetical protein CEP52_014668 [Fusarium oligoseptatum]|uniref:Uncharacterized protein n=1 Tax=Fusarium oligoseptatum TaxID=2604345 RepID=A0A428SK17_9HYPO|nr:hypothetical protein CEP52_014668 [Fusarium oligoseptatum]
MNKCPLPNGGTLLVKDYAREHGRINPENWERDRRERQELRERSSKTLYARCFTTILRNSDTFFIKLISAKVEQEGAKNSHNAKNSEELDDLDRRVAGDRGRGEVGDLALVGVDELE